MRKKEEITKRALLLAACFSLMLPLSGCQLISAPGQTPSQTAEETDESTGKDPADQTKETTGSDREEKTESETQTESEAKTTSEERTEPEESRDSTETETETDSKESETDPTEPESNEETGREIEKKTFGPNIGNGLNDHVTSGRVARGDGCTWFVQSSCLDNDGRGNATFYSENLYRIGDAYTTSRNWWHRSPCSGERDAFCPRSST